MNTKWVAINLIALSTAILLGWRLHISVNRFNAENDLAKIQPVTDLRQAMTPDLGLPPLLQPRGYDAAQFLDIAEKNVFSEARTNEQNAAAAVPETPPLSQKPILVGVTISGNQRLASIIDPTNPQSRRSQTKRIGDTYQGYTITDITTDQIVLESENRREIIPLHEGAKRPLGGKTAILSTRVVSFGEGGSSGGTPLAAATPARPAGQTPGQPTSVPVGRPAAAGQTGAAQTPAPGRTAAAPAAAPAAQPQSPYTSTDSQGRTIIHTPFGDIVRPAQPSQ